MKLLYCLKCHDTFNLSGHHKECSCGSCGGKYIDYLNAKVWGEKNKYFVLGFANSTFQFAINDQIYRGDSNEMMNYPGGPVRKGRDFTAFIIPEDTPTVKRFEERFE